MGPLPNSMITLGERSQTDYAAFHPEGQIKEARDRLNFLQGTQRFARSCDQYGVLCGDTSIIKKPARPSGVSLSPADADRPGLGFGGTPTVQ